MEIEEMTPKELALLWMDDDGSCRGAADGCDCEGAELPLPLWILSAWEVWPRDYAVFNLALRHMALRGRGRICLGP